MLVVFPIFNALLELVHVRVETQIFLILLAFFYATAFLWQTSFGFILFLRRRIPYSLKNVLLSAAFFASTLPIALWYFLTGVSVAMAIFKPISTDIWMDIIYKRVRYQELQHLPLVHCYDRFIDDTGTGIAKVITTNEEYSDFLAGLNRACRRPKPPAIDFTSSNLIVSIIPFRNCETLSRRVYQDDRNKRMLHITRIRPILMAVCYSVEQSAEAAVIPHPAGYTVELQVYKEHN